MTITLFHEKIYSCIAGGYMVYFKNLQLQLIVEVNGRVRGGSLTERGLARSIGISQPHMHNVLKGEKFLTPIVADKILFHLNLSLADLVRQACE
ncbi:MAG: XRE family transcriptional regulator [Bryobacteraceae bacterium]